MKAFQPTSGEVLLHEGVGLQDGVGKPRGLEHFFYFAVPVDDGDGVIVRPIADDRTT